MELKPTMDYGTAMELRRQGRPCEGRRSWSTVAGPNLTFAATHPPTNPPTHQPTHYTPAHRTPPPFINLGWEGVLIM